MEYRVEKLLEGLESQRQQLVTEVCSLNENLPNYTVKTGELSMQISNIDMQISNHLMMLKDIKIMELQNELAINTTVK